MFRATDDFNSIQRFCWLPARDAILKECREWEINFNLYGGNNKTSNTIRLFNYVYNVVNNHSSNLFFHEIKSNMKFNKNMNIPDIYLPGKLLFKILCISKTSLITGSIQLK